MPTMTHSHLEEASVPRNGHRIVHPDRVLEQDVASRLSLLGLIGSADNARLS